MWVLESHRYVYWNRVRDRKFMQWDALLIWVWVYECLFFYLSECDIHLCSKQITLYYQEQNFSLIDNSSGISVFWKTLCLLTLSTARYAYASSVKLCFNVVLLHDITWINA